MTYKLDGRIGDSPIIGSGTYADDKYGAISCTGIGEEFIKYVTAYDIIARVKYCKISLQQAIEDHLKECFKEGTGGAIAVNKDGEYGIAFDTTGMIRGYFNSNDTKFGHIAILKDDEQRVEWNTQLSREEVDEDYEGSDDDDDDDEEVEKKQIRRMMNNSPYLDRSLMQSCEIVTPQQNLKFISTHDVSNQNDRNDK